MKTLVTQCNERLDPYLCRSGFTPLLESWTHQQLFHGRIPPSASFSADDHAHRIVLTSASHTRDVLSRHTFWLATKSISLGSCASKSCHDLVVLFLQTACCILSARQFCWVSEGSWSSGLPQELPTFLSKVRLTWERPEIFCPCSKPDLWYCPSVLSHLLQQCQAYHFWLRALFLPVLILLPPGRSEHASHRIGTKGMLESLPEPG